MILSDRFNVPLRKKLYTHFPLIHKSLVATFCLCALKEALLQYFRIYMLGKLFIKYSV